MAQKYSPTLMLCCLFAVTLSHCKVPYDPTLKATDTNALIVEGYIDGAAPISFKLSRSRILSVGDTAAKHYQLNARVTVEDDHQDVFPLVDSGGGVYKSAGILNLNPSYRYRIHIFTADGREYASDMVPFKQSPVIDSIDWKLKDDGVQTFVNTHDGSNATVYYRWEYSETWEIHSSYYSELEYIAASNTVAPRTEQVYDCWQSDYSTSVYLGSSASLGSDVINEMPLAYIPPHDDKLQVLYSILVKQYALDVNGYNYWVAIRNNTERVGSIFDPQPNETTGNIHCVTNPSESVVGYVNAGNSTQKRAFISNSSLPNDWNLLQDCPHKIVPNNPDSLRVYFGGIYDPIAAYMVISGIVYSASYKSCVNCTFKGTNIKPPFWP
jgi:Domain of unknown function (DUF4249)